MHCSICHSDVVDGYYGGHICGGVPTACGPNCCGHKELQARLTQAEKEIEREHELFLVTHRENMKAVERIHELKTHLEAAEAKIAGLEKEIKPLREMYKKEIRPCENCGGGVILGCYGCLLKEASVKLSSLESSHNALRGIAQEMAKNLMTCHSCSGSGRATWHRKDRGECGMCRGEGMPKESVKLIQKFTRWQAGQDKGKAQANERREEGV